ncbi:uncharacterized protein [Alexandromys fortis]|uniref:uncharacterized protein isoform X2 n=1 Tax=Alexandromys fortis TaxID=100897 RepID=UPI002152B485|nr:uncharacterized protein LOC126514828 isoform X2 [Microtus fortis]
MPAGADGAQGRCQSPRRWQSLYPSLRLGPSGPRDRAARGREGRRRWRQRGGTRAGTSPSLRAVLRRGLGHPGGEDLEPNSRDTVTNHPRTRSSQAEVPPPPASAPGPVSCLPGRRGSQTQLKTEVWPATASLEVPGTHSMKNIPLPCRGPDALHRAPCLTPQLLRCPSRIRAWRIQWLLPKDKRKNARLKGISDLWGDGWTDRTLRKEDAEIMSQEPCLYIRGTSSYTGEARKASWRN